MKTSSDVAIISQVKIGSRHIVMPGARKTNAVVTKFTAAAIEATETMATPMIQCDVPQWKLFVAFSLFRVSGIRAGIYKRALDGNASSPQGLEAGLRYRASARSGWAVAQSQR